MRRKPFASRQILGMYGGLLVLVFAGFLAEVSGAENSGEKLIDREALVARHRIDWPNLKSTIPLGNGNFVFNADGTGLQTFAGNTMSHWAWHSFPLPNGITKESLNPWVSVESGRLKGPTTAQPHVGAWFDQNPHPVNLGRLGFVDSHGVRLAEGDCRVVSRKLDLWNGLLTTEFTWKGSLVKVETCVAPDGDIVAAKVISPLLEDGRLRLVMDFPAAASAGSQDPRKSTTPPWTGDFANPDGHETVTDLSGGKIIILRMMDDLRYAVRISGQGFEVEEGMLQVEGSKIEIVRAVYGLLEGDAVQDVTEIIAKKVAEGAREIPVRYTVLGDPAPRQEKWLELVYRKDGGEQVEMIPDGGAWTVPGGGIPHQISIRPAGGGDTMEILCHFSGDPKAFDAVVSFEEIRNANAAAWPVFWNAGGAIDLSESSDPRWKELERRIVLSQYLTAVHSAGDEPPAEVGLTGSDPWSAKFHMEMIWWHLAHYGLWDRWPMAEKALGFYERTKDVARAIAKNFDYAGFMWPKATSPQGWHDRNSVTHLLLWKQPHPIFFAELEYRLKPTRETLEKWKEIVHGTADFMAAYATKNAEGDGYSLWPVWPAREGKFDPDAKNTAFETAYWRYALGLAGQWRERLGEKPEPQWEAVRKGLPLLPVKDGLYIYEPDTDYTFTERKFDHLDFIAACGMLPPLEGYDLETGKRTVKEISRDWQWDSLWGWDFPWLAMAAARVGEPGLAIDALMNPSRKNRYNEIGACTGGTNPYLPGNGGLLYAVAMMAAGWDGAPDRHAPGFPDDGTWKVRWEGLKPAP